MPRLTLLVALAPLLLTAALAQDDGTARPDLVVNSLTNPPAVAFLGSGFSAGDRTRNVGSATARATVTRYYLSENGRRTAVGKRSVALLKPNTSSAGSVTAKVPDTLETGVYSLVACADGAGGVTEASERNNCRTAATKITIKKPPPRV